MMVFVEQGSAFRRNCGIGLSPRDSFDNTSSFVTGTDDFECESEDLVRDELQDALSSKRSCDEGCPSLSGSVGSADTCSSHDDEGSLQSADGAQPLSDSSDDDSDIEPFPFPNVSAEADREHGKPCVRNVSLRVLVFVAAIVSTLAYVESSRRASNIESIVSSTAGNRQAAGARISTLETSIRQMGRDASKLRAVNRELQEDVETITSDHQDMKSDSSKHDVAAMTEVFIKASETTDRRRDRVTGLWKDIQVAAWRAIQDKYGEGPHYVRFEVLFPESGLGAKTSSFVVKLASEHYMPHSVHVFLEMVTMGLFDGSSFPVSADHVIKAEPNRLHSDIIHAGFDRPSFPEYNSNYPHTEYTLGFMAKEGSTGFYINTLDNTDVHGPGAQQHNMLGLGAAGADPCFGEVISGRDVIDRIRDSPTFNDGFRIKQPVVIRKATVVASGAVEKSWPELDFTSRRRGKELNSS
mmetsp:Transcript_3644/g.7925  ORF Transcript_3644/g.7925 Transcript_3644/m.7925 type:complete len:467 (-) Transcript_3644:75-1475(-)